MHTEIGKVFNHKLSGRCKHLYHTHPTFGQCIYSISINLQSLSPEFPPITVGRNKFNKVYFLNDISKIHTLIQNKVCSALNGQQLAKFMEIAQRYDNLDEIIEEFVSFYPIKANMENYDYMSRKINYQKSLMQQNGYKRIQKQLGAELVLSSSPCIPSKINLVNQLLIGLDVEKDVILLQFGMVGIEIGVEMESFVISHSKNLIDLTYSAKQGDDEKKQHQLDDCRDYIENGRSFRVYPGLYEIHWEYSGLSLSTSSRWQRMAIKEYKTMRKKLKMTVIWRVWKEIIDNK